MPIQWLTCSRTSQLRRQRRSACLHVQRADTWSAVTMTSMALCPFILLLFRRKFSETSVLLIAQICVSHFKPGARRNILEAWRFCVQRLS
ncbi:hypothetical protein DENSPDRAFT_462578 [Dentipellis sp. KUC8613]|nr:hypothetical protein DENSPDRAFT_462578 [Dentipellis sp. KUC8613]